MTKTLAKKLARAKESKCPFCKDDDPLYGALEIESGGNGLVIQEASCESCNSTWNEVYELVDIVKTRRYE